MSSGIDTGIQHTKEDRRVISRHLEEIDGQGPKKLQYLGRGGTRAKTRNPKI